MARYEPRPQLREAAVAPAECALLVIDVQNFNCSPQGAMHAPGPVQAGDYWWSRVRDCLPRWQQLLQAARAAGCEVMFTVIQSLTADGRDRGLDYKLSGFHVPPGCWDAQVLPELAPGPDELVLPKSSSSVFASTTLDFVLRAMGKRSLLVAGCVTDQCVAHAVMDAADLGYLVTLVTDCCAAASAERHAAAVAQVAGYCRQRTLQQLLGELQPAAGQQPGHTAAREQAPSA